MREFTDQELIRREKAEKIREMGIDPYGSRFDRTAFNLEIKEKYQDIEHDKFENINANHNIHVVYSRDLCIVLFLLQNRFFVQIIQYKVLMLARLG